MENENTPEFDKSQNLTSRAAKSVAWAMSGNMGVSAFRFVGTMILARILTPEEFGLVGMALLFEGVVALFGHLGLTAALIQKQAMNEDYYHTAFWANVLIGFLLCAAMIGLSPLVARFFGEPSLVALVCALSVNFVLGSIASIHVVKLSKELQFKPITLIELASACSRLVLITILALQGLGIWSIVIGNIFDRLLKSFLFLWYVKWSPKLRFSQDIFFELFRFGRNLYGQSFLNYFRNNLDFIIVGRMLGAAMLAPYQFAYNVPHLVLTHVSESVGRVAFPLYSRLQGNNQLMMRGYLKSARLIAITTFPALGGLGFVANDFIDAAYGAQWEAASVPLQILCIAAALRSVFALNHSFLASVGRPDVGLKWSLFVLPVTALLLYYGADWGIVGIAVGITLASTLDFFMVWITLRLTKGSIVDYLKSLMPAALCTSFMIAILASVNASLNMDSLFYLTRLAANGLMGAVIYPVLVRLMFKECFFDCLQVFQQMVRKS